ncbi:ABC-2 type transporter [Beutenbergia cavernae DSM 12333]|uniref:ABC-2 type transporter n=1 Tax=Beutenbergia cavernae (strain ATCC BAA-8 / DSM 12333 / CCUG 43141 / JCM 11478 / NBRC 16432 / NCIMB 13614 / HKI 0122) TaxID=471853 RepID=C5C4B9_BEUC1|nr:ABC transporter permease [Beutenbergia cavernae]ACQ82043.1 ABC-2 type transporter [Beutenbergia cavernae DSM 12333]
MTAPAASIYPGGQAIPARRPGPRAWVALVGAESRMVVRDTAGLVVPIALPLLFLVMNSLGVPTDPLPGAGGMSAFDVFVVPLILTIVIATIGVVNMPSFLAYYRKGGVLRRLAVTPASPGMILVAQVITSALQTIVGIALALGVAVLWLGAQLPARPGLAIGVLALAAAAMYALGMAVAALAPSGNAATATGLGLFFALGAIGGMFGPTTNLPDGVARVGEMLPFGASVQALSAAWVGQVPEPQHLVALAVTVVVSGGVAARFFRWE